MAEFMFGYLLGMAVVWLILSGGHAAEKAWMDRAMALIERQAKENERLRKLHYDFDWWMMN